jgi:hypothetical protein
MDRGADNLLSFRGRPKAGAPESRCALWTDQWIPGSPLRGAPE